MRSYAYDNGTWTLTNDALPLVRVDDKYDFAEALVQLGFSRYGDSDCTCRAGTFKIYARDHEKASLDRASKELPYDFLCLFRLGGSPVRVWVTDLPSFFLLLTELDVHSALEDKEDILTKYLGDSDASRFLYAAMFALENVAHHQISVEIKQGKK